MFQDSLPLVRRGRKTVVLALFIFLAASVIAVINRMEDDVTLPSVDESTGPLTSAWLAPTNATSSISPLPVRNGTGSDSDSSVASDNSTTRVNLESSELRSTVVGTRPTEFDSSRTTLATNPASVSDSTVTQQWRRSTTSAVLPTREPRPLGGTYIALILLIAGSGVALWLKRTKRPGFSDTTIESLAKMALPNHQEVRLIRVRNREILIASTQSSVTVLQTFDVAPEGLPPTGSLSIDPADLNNIGDAEPTFADPPGRESDGKTVRKSLDRSASRSRAAISVDHPSVSKSDESRRQPRSFGAHLLERTQSTTEACND